MRIQVGKHFRRVRHGGEIGADCDRIRDQQSKESAANEWSWKFFAERAGQSLPVTKPMRAHII